MLPYQTTPSAPLNTLLSDSFTDPDSSAAFQGCIGNIYATYPNAIIIYVQFQIDPATSDTVCAISYCTNDQTAPGNGITMYNSLVIG